MRSTARNFVTVVWARQFCENVAVEFSRSEKGGLDKITVAVKIALLRSDPPPSLADTPGCRVAALSWELVPIGNGGAIAPRVPS